MNKTPPPIPPKPASMRSGKIQAKAKPRGRARARNQQRPAPVTTSNGQFRQVGAASAYSTGISSSAPRITASRDSARIVHREFIGNVSGSAAYSISNTFALNPGVSATFPWLATQAQGWEQYRFDKLKFSYFTRTGTSTPGSVQLIPDYDALDAAPASEQIASSYEDVVEDAPWKDLVCNLKPNSMFSMGNKKFIRTGPLSANEDLKTYDVGNLFVGTVDGTAVNWGKLWVEYDVTLSIPQLPPAGAPVMAFDHMVAGSAPTTANILPAYVHETGSTTLASVAGSIVTITNPGRYLVLYHADTTSDNVNAVPTVSAGSTLITSFFGSQAGNLNCGSGAANLAQALIVQAAAGCTLTFNNTVVGGVDADLLISQIPVTAV